MRPRGEPVERGRGRPAGRVVVQEDRGSGWIRIDGERCRGNGLRLQLDRIVVRPGLQVNLARPWMVAREADLDRHPADREAGDGNRRDPARLVGDERGGAGWRRRQVEHGQAVARRAVARLPADLHPEHPILQGLVGDGHDPLRVGSDVQGAVRAFRERQSQPDRLPPLALDLDARDPPRLGAAERHLQAHLADLDSRDAGPLLVDDLDGQRPGAVAAGDERKQEQQAQKAGEPGPGVRERAEAVVPPRPRAGSVGRLGLSFQVVPPGRFNRSQGMAGSSV